MAFPMKLGATKAFHMPSPNKKLADDTTRKKRFGSGMKSGLGMSTKLNKGLAPAMPKF